jgi:Predicted metal-dependent hydrolase with the TIM-barrel fold
LPEVHEILALIAEADIVLATGHLSPAEVVALVDAAKEHGVRKILIQHADLGIAPIPHDLQTQLAKKGAIVEKCCMACGDDFRNLSPEQMAASIKRLGADSCVLVTDYGQRHNIPVVEALSRFVEELLKFGITERDMETLIVHNPRRLLGI